MANNFERQQAAMKGRVPPECDNYVYNGDMDTKAIAPTQHSLDDVNESINKIRAKVRVGDISLHQARELCQLLTEFQESITIPQIAIERPNEAVPAAAQPSDVLPAVETQDMAMSNAA
jgi:hypothetical protein